MDFVSMKSRLDVPSRAEEGPAVEDQTVNFVSMTPNSFRAIARMSSGVDMYNLALTSRIFFVGYEAGSRVLATDLLSIAMRGFLKRTLREVDDHGNGLRLEDIFEHNPEPETPRLVISGSCVVQAIVGQRYPESDVDLFCTWGAAPQVRRRLIESCGMLCCGACETVTAGQPATAHARPRKHVPTPSHPTHQPTVLRSRCTRKSFASAPSRRLCVSAW